ncbi:MAG: hypothetical protein A3J28_14730 [Acidobacteria bacterium RIFCSPLOWO2_12_FULL_60_22]|nr:MAG: hypothetical protein A3J28_14730 [Acidobacteria bacterium RIFCSPLOWO2_12_FULL_60_22]
MSSAPVRLVSSAGEAEALSGGRGEFRFDNLAPGDYEIQVVLQGFEPLRRRVRLGTRSVQNLNLRLTLARMRQELTVAEPAYQVNTDTTRNADTISVEGSALDNLPVLDLNYLSALSRFLEAGAPGGGGTSLIVDGMEMRNIGVTASAIQEIRINNNPYTVEYPRWSRRRIEVITKSSADRYHGTFNFLFRDHHLNAREALAVERPKEQRRIYEGSLFGPVGNSKKTSFLLSGAREEEDFQAVVFAQGPRGPIHENVPTPQVNTYLSARISWQPSDSQSLFFQQNFQDRWQENIGVGGTTLEEAGAQSRFREDEFTFNHRFVFSPKMLSQFRVLVGRYWAPTRSNLQAPRAVVTDAFTGGGAQADRLATELHTSITWLLTQTAGKHTLKYGINIPDWSRRGLVDRANEIGSLFFASLADYTSNRPYAALLQRGNPKVIFVEKNVGGFFQDEWQLRKNLSIAAGLRYDWQNYFGDGNNLAPRLAVAWSPGQAKNLVLRGGAGFFFERSGPGPIGDTLRFDGVRLRRYLLSGDQFADLSQPLPESFPTSVHRLEPGAELPNAMQFGAGAEYQLARGTTLAVHYVGVRAVKQLRSRDGNAPLPPDFAARPDPNRNVLRWIESAGRLEGNSLEITVRGRLAPQVTGTAQYVLSQTMSDTGSVNWYPSSGAGAPGEWYPADSFAPSGEWGRADNDRRHQFNFLSTATLHRWANFGLSVSLLSGIPFNLTTGRDDNRDGLAIDRPAGVTRNTGEGPGFAALDLRWYREFRLRPSQNDKSPAATISVDAFNLFNRVNYRYFVGALSSPFLGRAVATQPPRRWQLGMRVQF